MSEELDFSLPDTEKKGTGSGTVTIRVLLVVILLAVVANLVLGMARRNDAAGLPAGISETAVEAQKQLAMRMERQALHERAAKAWERYLEMSSHSDKGRASILYRIGKLYQDAGRYDMALENFYRSEAAAEIADLAPEIGRRVQECLEGLGKFAALRHELKRRVAVDGGTAGPDSDTVAEIGAWKISSAELDRRIEEQIQRQLDQFAAHLPEDERNRHKQELLKRFSGSKERLQLLHQIVMEEVLYRKAREDGLHEEPETRAVLWDTERKILAQQAMERELADAIKITPSDLQTFYEAHREQYVVPERRLVSHIRVPTEDKAQAVLASLEKGEPFAALAKVVSEDEATAGKGGELPGWIVKGTSQIPGIGNLAPAVEAIFGTDAGKVVTLPFKSEQGLHIFKVRQREPQRRKTFDEVHQEVYRDLRSRKEHEVQQRLLTHLQDRYDVVIHTGKFAEARESKAGPDDAQ